LVQDIPDTGMQLSRLEAGFSMMINSGSTNRQGFSLKIFTSLRHAAIALVLGFFATGPIPAAFGQSMPSAAAPAQAKAARVEALKLPADAVATVIRLGAPPAAAVEKMKQDNGRAKAKRVQVGFGRELPDAAAADSRSLKWAPVEGGFAARWQVTSAEAKALRVGLVATKLALGLELRFTGTGAPDTVYGPVTEADLARFAGTTYWSPVLEGDTATIELFVPGASVPDIAMRVSGLSHLVVSAADPKAELKAIGDSGFCEVNFICRAASDAALARTGKAEAKITFTENSSTFLCSGTLLNSAGGQFIPYFYTANHCIDTQSVASTLSAWWFYESTACGTNSLSPNFTQTFGGAAFLYGDDPTDVTFLRLNQSPPSGVIFSGWDAAMIATGTPLTAIHHPAGDLKKVSLGSMGGYTVPDSKTIPYIQSNWNSIATGVTEGGSSGSGIFTAGSGEYVFRGGLLGGPSSCSAPASDRFDWYSRFDLAFPALAQYLNASTPAPNNYTALWWNPNENGWGINVEQQGDIAFATLFTYDTNGDPLWLVMSSGARQGSGDTFSGTLFRTTGTPFNLPFTGANVTQVGSMTLSFSNASNGTLSYTVNGTPVTKTITKQLFGPAGAPTCTLTTGSRAGASNFTDLWWNPSESGWGINLTQQGSIMFATLFVYGSNGQVLWLVMSDGRQQGDGSFTGALYRTQGNGAFNTVPWPGVTVGQVGSMTLRFNNGESGTLTYTVNGTTVTKSIIRQVFSSPVPVCSN